MTHILREAAFNRERTRAMQCEILQKNANGFNLSIPQHCVSANYDLKMKKFRYSPRVNRRINPYRLGFSNKYVDVHFNFPYECIGITEAQKYLNSRMSMYFPEWQSRWYEQHGHNNLDIWLDTQRPMLIDANIRELSRFIEIVKLDIIRDKNNRIKGLKWVIRAIDNSSLFDKYMSSGKTDESCYEEMEVTANYNVFECYDSQSCKPKFYDGHFDQDFDYLESESPEETPEGYIEFLKKYDDELPDNFYQSRSIKKGKTND